MPNIHLQAFFVQQFSYSGRAVAEARLRPVGAVALLRAGGIQDPTVQPATPRNVNGVSLSMLGSSPATDDDRENDSFLPLFDHGHLFGHQYGGSTRSYNLVPMLRNANRGGAWAAFEAAITALGGSALLAMRCSYSDVDDGRIPVRVEAALIPLTHASGNTLETEWALWLPSLRHHVRAASAGGLRTHLEGILMPHIRATAGGRECEFRQEPFRLVRPYYALVNPAQFCQRFLAAQQEAWTVETDGRFAFSLPPTEPNPWLQFTPRYRLPGLTFRPYAALDYMALRGQLDDALYGADNSQVNITSPTVHDAATFNPVMKSFAMYANLIQNALQTRGQVAYLSDASVDLLHPDPGTAGEGLVLDPEFDHVIPRTPNDGGLPGPTIFSNLHITSPRYNSQKGNHLWVVPKCVIGAYRAILQPTRGSLKRSADWDPDEERKENRVRT